MNVENSLMIEEDWEYQDVEIGEVESLLSEYDIEVESPDGFVPVTKFVNKGKKKIYEVINNNDKSKIVRCSGNHLFYTDHGWKTVNQLYASLIDFKILMDTDKYETFEIRDTFKVEDVVDITIEHNNHRYYTNGFVSHNTNMGKSLIMNSLAVSNVFQNKKVLYISCELSEERTAERSLANLFDMETKNLKMLSKDKFHNKYTQFIEKFSDNFIVVEYPTKSINCNDLRNLLKELELKLKYKPDIVYLDQIENLNPVHKSRSDQTHNEMKRVTMEVRGLAVESNVPWISAIQTNRDGMGGSEIDLTNTGDSIGYVQIADLVIGVTQTEELKAAGKMIWSVLKNRFGPNKQKLTVCVEYSKMRITNDDEAFVEFRNDGDKTAPTESEKKQKKLSIVNDVANIIDKNKSIEDDKFMNLADDYD